jgi:phosphoenolpyruvate synthase/pyruvate phosphate dikinase
MAFVKSLLCVDRRHTALAGGKGASLGELARAGLPVPVGFVVLSTAFEHFLEQAGITTALNALLNSVNPEVIESVDEAAQKIQSLVLRADLPADVADEVQTSFQHLSAPQVAVRSSATVEDGSSAAWAGQLDSFLNTTESTLKKNIQRCWASLFTPRAVAYRFAKGLQSEHISLAVVVQKMVQSDVSGVAFSVHPLALDSNQIVIEAGFGLGEAIVSGDIIPDSYVVDKNERIILNTTTHRQERMLVRDVVQGNKWIEVPHEKQARKKLSGQQILALSEIIVDIEMHYGFPCDIEWAMSNSVFSVTQSRPITTLGAAKRHA